MRSIPSPSPTALHPSMTTKDIFKCFFQVFIGAALAPCTLPANLESVLGQCFTTGSGRRASSKVLSLGVRWSDQLLWRSVSRTAKLITKTTKHPHEISKVKEIWVKIIQGCNLVKRNYQLQQLPDQKLYRLLKIVLKWIKTLMGIASIKAKQ